MKNDSFTFYKKKIRKYIALIIVTCIFSINEIPADLTFFQSFSFISFGLIFPILSYLIYVAYTFDLMQYYNKNYMCFLRYKNKKEYIEELLKFCFKNLILIFCTFTFFLLLFTFLYFLFNGYPVLINAKEIIYFLLTLYDIFKVFVMTALILHIGILLSKFFSRKIGVTFLLLIELIMSGWIYSVEIVDSFSKVHIFYGYYFIRINYNTIFLDIFSFTLQVILLLAIVELIKYLMLRYKKIYIED